MTIIISETFNFMVKSALALRHNTDIKQFIKCTAFLKRQNVGFVSKKSNVLSAEQIKKFMIDAPNESWLFSKVILSLGIFGAFLKDGKTHKSRRFVISIEDCPFDPCDLIRKYIAVRPKQINGNRLLVGYIKNICFAKNVGKNH